MEDRRLLIKRLSDSRTRLVLHYPFYGNLVLHLKFSLANCGTAATDLRRIIFDPQFLHKLSDEEIDFVLMHEVMHCALNHPKRRKNRNNRLFNIACDIVVNSNIMHSMGQSSFQVAGEEAMHLTPKKKEGFLYSAEEVYEMLLDKYDGDGRGMEMVAADLEKDYGDILDDHDIWQILTEEDFSAEEWKENLKAAAKFAGNAIPAGARKLMEEYEHQSKLDWKKLLQDFVKEVCDRYDFTFAPPDKRFTTGDFILPSFIESTDQMVKNIWFVVDTSGSISNEQLAKSYGEIKTAIEQFTYLEGYLSFFDTVVTEPVKFDSMESLYEIKPTGGGGTSFQIIFEYMKENMLTDLPEAVIILTDGYALYPEKKEALGVPVLWVLVENEEDAPWGVSVHVE